MAIRQNTFILKRSGVPGKVPSPGDIQLGEIAVNFADAKAYLSGTTAGSILPIGWDRVSITGGTISGNLTVTGTTISNIFSGATISGGTYYGNGSNLTGIPDYYVTGGTLSTGGTLTLTRNDNVNVTISGFNSGGSTPIGFNWKFDTTTTNANPGSKKIRYNSSLLSGITAIYINDVNNDNLDVSAIFSSLPIGTKIFAQQHTDATTGVLLELTSTAIDNTGWWTFPVSYISDAGGTVPANNSEVSVLFLTPGTSDTYTTGTTFSNNVLTIKKNNGSPDVTQLLNNFSGLTINGNLTVTGTTTSAVVSATTISGGTFFGNGANLTNLPDTFTTGFTYSNNNFTISRNQGLSALTTNISTMTGLTVNGNLTVTGTTTSSILSATTLSATTIVSNSILPIKNNVVSGSTFSGNPKKATITFTTAFSDNNYSVTVTGSDSRTFTIESKSSTGFTINANANASFTGEVFWQAIKFGETS